MRTHVQQTVSRCFAILRQLRQIRHSVPTDTFQSCQPCANSFGLWQQCPGWPSGLLGTTTPDSAQRGCVVDLHLRRSDHISDALACLNWLRVPDRIEFKIAVLTYKFVHGLAPGYLGRFVGVADLPSRRLLRLSAPIAW